MGERLIRMHIQTAIRVRIQSGPRLPYSLDYRNPPSFQPNTSDSLEIDEVFHFAENNDAIVVPIAFEATLEREEGTVEEGVR